MIKQNTTFTLILETGSSPQQIINILNSVNYTDFMDNFNLTGILDISKPGKHYMSEGETIGVKLIFTKKEQNV